jgi:hypothetical protein
VATKPSIAIPWLAIGIGLSIGCQTPEREMTLPVDDGAVDILAIAVTDGGATENSAGDSDPTDAHKSTSADGTSDGDSVMDAGDAATDGAPESPAMGDVLPEAGPPDVTLLGPCGLATISLPTVGWSATVSVLSPGDIPQKAFDGRIDTRWSTGRNGARGDWFRLDLGSPRTVEAIRLDVGGEVFATDFLRGYSVAISTDDSRYQEIATGTGAMPITSITFPAARARYLKITLTMASPRWWGIAELIVCGR